MKFIFSCILIVIAFFHNKIYFLQLFSCLDKAMKLSQSAQLKELHLLYDKGVEQYRKKQDDEFREKRKQLMRTTSDKQELDR